MSAKATEDYLSQAAATTGTGLKPPENAPRQYKTRQRRYLAERLDRFTEARAYLADDYTTAEVQGLTSDFYAYTTLDIRLSDVTTDRVTDFFGKKSDDYKRVLLPPRCLEYIPAGAKLQTMGITWICLNPTNLSSASASAVVARCNATYNSYDDYGNVVTEPLCIQKADMVANRNESHQNMVLAEGYYTVLCQLNDVTRKLHLNKRVVLGSQVYHITGLTDFIQEFTGDRDSAHLLAFTARLDEPTAADDITVNYIANGNTYSFDGKINGADNLKAGQKADLTALFAVNGKEKAPSADFPLTWEWKTSNPSVADVSADGQVTALAEGITTITATLRQNPAIAPTLTLSVNNGEAQAYVAFIGAVPNAVEQLDIVIISAAYYENGVETDEPLQWAFTGAAASCYVASVESDGKTAVVACVTPSSDPLMVVASYGEYSASTIIRLEGM